MSRTRQVQQQMERDEQLEAKPFRQVLSPRGISASVMAASTSPSKRPREEVFQIESSKRRLQKICAFGETIALVICKSPPSTKTHRFNVHKSLIKYDSAFLREGLANGTTRINLTWDDTRTVKNYLAYLYTQPEDLGTVLYHFDQLSDLPYDLAFAWRWGAKLKSARYMNVVVDTVLQLPASLVKKDMGEYVGIATYWRKDAPDASVVPLWLLDVLASGLMQGYWDMSDWEDRLTKDFMGLLLKSVANRSRVGGRMPAIEDRGRYVLEEPYWHGESDERDESGASHDEGEANEDDDCDDDSDDSHDDGNGQGMDICGDVRGSPCEDSVLGDVGRDDYKEEELVNVKREGLGKTNR